MTPDIAFDPGTKLARQHLRRLRQLTRIAQFTLVGVAALALLQGHRLDALAMLLTAIALTGVAGAIKQAADTLAMWILLGSLTLLLTFLAWHTHGISGAIPLGFGGVMVFCAMLGERRQLILLAVLISTICLAIGAATQWQLRPAHPPEAHLISAVIVATLLSTIAYGAYLMTRDYRAALTDLSIEDARMRYAQAKIEQLALHDTLTKLPNRTLAERLFYAEYARASAAHQALAILLIDIDNLKRVNDSLGHSAGDQVLIEAAARLTALLPKHAHLGHYAGDKFIVIMPIIADTDELAPRCAQILAELAKTYHYQSLDIFCSASMGAVIAPAQGSDFDTLLRKADIAVHAAKDTGRNSVQFYEDSYKKLRGQQLSMVSDIKKGIARGEFCLHYQPKIDLRQHQLIGFEALLRWQHPTLGAISPGVFIPLAESSGLIIQLGEWIIDEVCRQIAEWRAAGRRDFNVAINVSCVQFKRGNLADLIDAALERHGIAAHFLELELTESLIIEDNERLQETLKYLRQRGLQLSIDDFGTGYSNLGYLKKFEVGKLKIDQSFIHKLTHSSEDAAIVSAIIQLCHNLGLISVAEGVEDAATADRLAELGCTQGQGFFWSKPLAAEDVTDFWQSWERADTAV